MQEKNKKKANIIAGICVVVLALAGLVSWIFIRQAGQANKIAVIYQNGVVVKQIDLEKVTKSYEFTLKNKEGGSNTIKVEPGGISVVEASCPDHTCMHAGVITNGVVPIICAPNHLTIKIEEKKTADFDQISY